MKMTLDLPDEVVRALKMRAVVQGRTIKNLVTELLREELGLDPHVDDLAQTKSPPAGIELTASGFPVFVCLPVAPASRMSVDELLALEQNAIELEDLKRARDFRAFSRFGLDCTVLKVPPTPPQSPSEATS